MWLAFVFYRYFLYFWKNNKGLKSPINLIIILKNF